MADHREMVTLPGGAARDITWGEEDATGGFIPVLRSPGAPAGFEGVTQRAALVWRDGSDDGEIQVHPEWDRRAGTANRLAAEALGNATAGRPIRWRVVPIH